MDLLKELFARVKLPVDQKRYRTIHLSGRLIRNNCNKNHLGKDLKEKGNKKMMLSGRDSAAVIAP